MLTNKFCMILVLAVLVLAVPIDAKPEKITMGPYTVSFDLGNVSAYSISTTQQLEGETLWGIPYTGYVVIVDDQETEEEIFLGIKDFHDVAGYADNEQILKTTIESTYESTHCGEPLIVTRTIDGKPGVIALMDCLFSSATPQIGYWIVYPLDYYAENNTMKSLVMIGSSYPWDVGTSNLVKTIHVEKK